MLVGKPVTDPFCCVALLARHALVVLKPLINHRAQRVPKRDRAWFACLYRRGGAEIVLVDVLIDRSARYRDRLRDRPSGHSVVIELSDSFDRGHADRHLLSGPFLKTQVPDLAAKRRWDVSQE